ncbi:MAG TPA: amidohydrolase family protein [Bacillota bacterium]|nr:amidohydrolase family protein [Bacillota bacterium]
MPPDNPLNSPDNRKFALMGRVVSMNDSPIIERGVVYLEKNAIIGVQDFQTPAPPGFENVPVINTNGIIFPGLIELHNHLSYNLLKLWVVPRKFTNRDQWLGTPEYRKLISGPMQVIGKTPELIAPLVRYVEAKCLFAGVTTSQGIKLFSDSGITRYYRGNVRNVEEPMDPALPKAKTKIGDIDPRKVKDFLKDLTATDCLLYHLSEGTDQRARKHFLDLQIKDTNDWALRKSLAAIHATALEQADFEVLARFQAGMIWSPLSNLLLYGDTAKVNFAKEFGIRMGIGADWSPTGSKNLLGELKVAHIYSKLNGGIFSDEEIVGMATRNAAEILGWEKAVGTIEPGKKADLVVIPDSGTDPYEALIQANEADIRLVMIDGIPRYGDPALMNALNISGEDVSVGGKAKMVFLEQNTSDPAVEPVSLMEARKILTEALQKLKDYARELEKPKEEQALVREGRPETEVWTLALDDFNDEWRAGNKRSKALQALMSQPLSEILEPMELDPLTVVDDEDYLKRIDRQTNLPEEYKVGLRGMY